MLTFYGRYFESVEARVHRLVQNDDYTKLDSDHTYSVFSHTGRLLGSPTIGNLEQSI